MTDLRSPAALAMALEAVRRLGSISAAAAVCAEAGFRVSRPNLSRYLSNTLDTVSNVETALLACFDRHACPYLGFAVEAAHCLEINCGPVPTWDPAALDQRRCCQTCPHKPNLSGETQ